MKWQQLTLALTTVNVVLLLLTITQARSATAQGVAPILKARALELVDDRGVVRARLGVKGQSGPFEIDLFDKSGIIHVKLSTGEDGSWLVMTDEGADAASRSYVQLLAKRTGTAEWPKTTSITVRCADGRERVITP